MDGLVSSSRARESFGPKPCSDEVLQQPPPTVGFSPTELVRHEVGQWRGVHAETIQVIGRAPFEYGFKNTHHLLIAIEQGARYDGELLVEGLPASTRRSCSHKLILVPTGRRFFGWQSPKQLTRSVCLYIDPATVAADPDCRFDEAELEARMLFDDIAVWQTVAKLKGLIGSGDPSLC
jgi:AraC family transcriptional regulator